MLLSLMHRLGLRSWLFQVWSFSGIALCIVLWIRAKTLDQDERGNAERRALFAGLWPPTLWLVGQSLDELERERRPRLGRGRG